ncbi:hypothetical protein CesoFtcFv8_009751 [Champsocephalus esox]|uniref:Uncharacterized protein n=2 Tax=Champsocephalus TaxID=52236 RepID=A0AAN8DR80_CHAGU|nr:hypothetical protein CesoFtcFv8_009751 [Champsocephalus esox]KAK5924645.1 hypothetical protein CgunFtcFv8_017241 [Champsocephalus gunnari]
MQGGWQRGSDVSVSPPHMLQSEAGSVCLSLGSGRGRYLPCPPCRRCAGHAQRRPLQQPFCGGGGSDDE